mmetsp:Transcript_22965/g.39074  ORF Transcript_22965/g.39074 Transcript_22965/m.39074 type:complete len:382 (-) Transcript_22965:553-1698(-)
MSCFFPNQIFFRAKRAIQWIDLFLCCQTESIHFFRNFLLGTIQNIYKSACMSFIFICEKSVTFTGFACSSCSANSMNIVFNSQWKRNINHMLHIFNINTTSSNVCGNQNFRFTRFELFESGSACILRLVAVQRHTTVPAAIEHLFDARRLFFVQTEHDDAAVFRHAVQQLDKQLLFVARVVEHAHVLRDAAIGARTAVGAVLVVVGARRANRDAHHVVFEIVARQFANGVGPRGRVHERLHVGALAFAALHHRAVNERRNAAHLAIKAHVEHAIGFVQHKHAHARQIELIVVVLRQIEQTTGRGDDKRRRLQRFQLRGFRHAAVHAHRLHAIALLTGWRTVDGRFDHFVNLCGKFARRRQHHHLRLISIVWFTFQTNFQSW